MANDPIFYVSKDGESAKTTKFYASESDSSIKIKRIYGSIKGKAAVVYDTILRSKGPTDYFEYLAREDGTLTISNHWNGPIRVVNLKTGVDTQISSGTNAYGQIPVSKGDKVRVEKTELNGFRTWVNNARAFASGPKVELLSMPTLNAFTTDAEGTTAGDYFFAYFNYNGSIISLPDGSFDTSNIEKCGNYFFYQFNSHPSNSNVETFDTLPAYSFELSGMKTIGTYFFAYFNQYGKIKILPYGSFNTSSIENNAANAFYYFNGYTSDRGAIPKNTANYTKTTNKGTGAIYAAYANGGSYIREYVSKNGQFYWQTELRLADHYIEYKATASGLATITNKWTTPLIIENITQGTYELLPASTNTSISSVQLALSQGDRVRLKESTDGVTFRTWINDPEFRAPFDGVPHRIINMPPISQFTTDVAGTTIPQYAFNGFCGENLQSLPNDSLDTSSIKTIQANSFNHFISKATSLLKLPDISFNFDNVITIGDRAFKNFAGDGETAKRGSSLSYLPTGSFSFSSTTTIGAYSFSEFNKGGKLEHLPEGSFDFSKVSILKDNFCSHFNEEGALVELPADSFNTYQMSGTFATAFQDFNKNGALPWDIYNYNPRFMAKGSLTAHYTNHADVSLTINQPFRFKVAESGEVGFFELEAEGDGTARISNKWSTAVFVDNLTANTLAILNPNQQSNITMTTGDIVRIYETLGKTTFRTWSTYANPLVKGVKVKVTKMPAMDHFTTTRYGKNTSANFFYYFNNTGTISSFPEGSFNTSNLEDHTGDNYFAYFNNGGLYLESLPAGSFQFPKLTKMAGNNCFRNFNSTGSLLSLPEGSFNFPKLAGAFGQYSFAQFNYNGKITTLPDGSFNFPFENAITLGNYSFQQFVASSHFTSFGKNTFNTSGFRTFGSYCFQGFHQGGNAEYLPENSFDTSNVTSMSSYCFQNFNYTGALRHGTQYFTNTITKVSVTAHYKNSNIASKNIAANANLEYAMEVEKDQIRISLSEKNTPYLITNHFGKIKVSYGHKDGGGELEPLVPIPNSDEEVYEDFTVVADNPNNVIVIKEVEEGAFRHPYATPSSGEWKNPGGFVYRGESTTATAKIVCMPSMDKFTVDEEGTIAPDGFFFNFNRSGCLTSLPEGSFDISKITSVGDSFFEGFNGSGLLTSLPVGSFRTEQLTEVPNAFFSSFNTSGYLSSLPAGSFHTENLVKVGDSAFSAFNYCTSKNKTKLTTLPTGSFNFSNLREVGAAFCSSFNGGSKYSEAYGGFTSLPAGSFNFSNLEKEGGSFFSSFNSAGSLTSLPDGSFQFPKLTEVGRYFFYAFNGDGGKLTRLPNNSFNLNNIGKYGECAFWSFNGGTRYSFSTTAWDRGGYITSLPAGSFHFKEGAIIGENFFWDFNEYGALTSLPAGSFNTDALRWDPNVPEDAEERWKSYFKGFNNGGALTSLPAGSFKTENITGYVQDIFSSFDERDPGQSWAVYPNNYIQRLPEGSFNLENITDFGTEDGLISGSFVRFMYGNKTTYALPTNSFHFGKNVESITGFEHAFSWCNFTSLPAGSFNWEGIKRFSGFDLCFNCIKLTSLPELAFRFDSAEYIDGMESMFYSMPASALPEGSFNFNQAQSSWGNVFGFSAFKEFNASTYISTLPNGSFYTRPHLETYAGSYGDNWKNFNGKHVDSNGTTNNRTGSLAKTNIPMPGFQSPKDNDWHYYVSSTSNSVESLDNGAPLYYNWNRQAMIEIEILEAGSITITNKWNSNVIIWRLSTRTNLTTLTSGGSYTVNLAKGDRIRVREGSSNSTFRSWRADKKAFVSGVPVRITSMPPLEYFTIAAYPDTRWESAGDNFFYYFNYKGSITEYPRNEFDLSFIRTIGNNFFEGFDYEGSLKKLNGKFDFSRERTDYYQITEGYGKESIKTIGNNAFQDAFHSSALEEVPENFFSMSSDDVETIGNNFCRRMFMGTKVTDLTDAKFSEIGGWSTKKIGDYFFAEFNRDGAIEWLTNYTFLDGIQAKAVGIGFFQDFNLNGKLKKSKTTSGPVNIAPYLVTAQYDGYPNSIIRSNEEFVFSTKDSPLADPEEIPEDPGDEVDPFEDQITLEVLQSGSVTFYNKWNSTIQIKNPAGEITKIKPRESKSFSVQENDNFSICEGKIGKTFRSWSGIEAPLVYANTARILTFPSIGKFTEDEAGTIAGKSFFADFNQTGGIVEFPEGSLDTTTLQSSGDNFFFYFNYNGKLERLPGNSFNITALKTTGNHFFERAFYNSTSITFPEGSFNTSNLTSAGEYFLYYFYRPLESTKLELPEGFLGFDNLTILKNYFCYGIFDGRTQFLNHPAGMFNTQNVIEIGNNCFYGMSYPLANEVSSITFTENERNFENVITIGDYFAPTWGIGDKFIQSPKAFNFDKVKKLGNYCFSTIVSTGLHAGAYSFKSLEEIGNSCFGSCSSLPEGAFQLNKLKKVGERCFYSFCSSNLTSLPTGSFQFDSLISTGINFCSNFLSNASKLTSLPEGSFQFPVLETLGGGFANFVGPAYSWSNPAYKGTLPEGSFQFPELITMGTAFSSFYYRCDVTSFPSGAFNFPKLKSITGSSFVSFFSQTKGTFSIDGSFNFPQVSEVGDDFFNNFFTSSTATITVGSNNFNFESLEKAGRNFFASFCNSGGVLSIGSNCLNFPNLKTIGQSAFYNFNYSGKLSTIGPNSLNLKALSTAGDSFFARFNCNGALTSLPEGSFQFPNLINYPQGAFDYFNQSGKLTSLPEGSFDFSNSLVAGFNYFNQSGELETLPKGSFVFNPNQTNLVISSFQAFNSGGKLRILPYGSFDTRKISYPYGSFSSFNDNKGRLPKDLVSHANLKASDTYDRVSYWDEATQSSISEYPDSTLKTYWKMESE